PIIFPLICKVEVRPIEFPQRAVVVCGQLVGKLAETVGVALAPVAEIGRAVIDLRKKQSMCEPRRQRPGREVSRAAKRDERSIDAAEFALDECEPGRGDCVGRWIGSGQLVLSGLPAMHSGKRPAELRTRICAVLDYR